MSATILFLQKACRIFGNYCLPFLSVDMYFGMVISQKVAQLMLNMDTKPNMMGMIMHHLLLGGDFSICMVVLYAKNNEAIPKTKSPTLVMMRMVNIVFRRFSMICSSCNIEFSF